MINDEELIMDLGKLNPDKVWGLSPFKYNEIYREITYEGKSIIIYNPYTISKQDLKERIIEEIKKLNLKN